VEVVDQCDWECGNPAAFHFSKGQLKGKKCCSEKAPQCPGYRKYSRKVGLERKRAKEFSGSSGKS
jgi:hypothetical protein